MKPDRAEELITNKQWPCYFFKSDTTGEKDFEEFFTDNEDLYMERFETIGVIQNEPEFDEARLNEFMDGIEVLREKGTWDREDIIKLYFSLLPEFEHKETGKYLGSEDVRWTVFLIFYFLVWHCWFYLHLLVPILIT